MRHHHHTPHQLIIWHEHDDTVTYSGGHQPTQGRHDHADDPPCPCPLEEKPGYNTTYRPGGDAA